MHMISYAQNREDVLLRRLFPDQPTGFYIDVGANLPTDCSVTKHFYDRGWFGVNIEPGHVFKELQAERPHDINLNVGLSDRKGSLAFYEFPSVSGLSTFSPEEGQVHQSRGLEVVVRSVPVTTLAAVCARYVDRTIDFISIDVEGYEQQVLEGGDWRRWRPRVVLVEATRPNTTIPTHQLWEPILLRANYLFAYFDGLNRFYVRAEDRELLKALQAPVNVFDDFVPYEFVKHHREQDRKHQQLMGENALLVKKIAAIQATAGQAEVAQLAGQVFDLENRQKQLLDELARLQTEHQALREREEGLAKRVAETHGLGTGSLAVAYGFHRMAQRFPRISRTVLKLFTGMWHTPVEDDPLPPARRAG